jgi:hypothetical protein
MRTVTLLFLIFLTGNLANAQVAQMAQSAAANAKAATAKAAQAAPQTTAPVTTYEGSWVGDQFHLKVLENGRQLGPPAVYPTALIPKGTHTFTWEKPEKIRRWNNQGRVDEGEVNFLRKEGGSMVRGGGVYTSLDPWDSRNFGKKAVTFEMPEDIRVILGAGSSRPEIHDVFLQNGISGIRYGDNNTWINFFDAKPLSKVREVNIEDFYESDLFKNKRLSFLELGQVDSRYPLKPSPKLSGGAYEYINDILQGKPITAERSKDLLSYIPSISSAWGSESPFLRKSIGAFDEDEVMRKIVDGGGGALYDVVQYAHFKDLKPSQILAGKYPELNMLIKGEPITGLLREKLKEDVEYQLSYRADFSESNLKTRLQKEMRGEVASWFKTKFGTRVNPFDKVEESDEGLIRMARDWNVDFSEIFPGRNLGTPPRFESPTSETFGELHSKLEGFGKDLADSLEFIDFHDLAQAMAKGNPAPWTLYDEPGKPPLLERWRKAQSEFKSSSDMGSNLNQLHDAISATPESGFRGSRVVAGGDFILDGKGYYTLSAAEKKVLEENPFLVTEIRKNPYSTQAFDAYLARHEYPSAATFKKFSSYLNPNDIQLLEEAEAKGLLKDETSARFKDLTKLILGRLVERVGKSDKTSLSGYHVLMSVHPWEDYNGRTLRAYYKLNRGEPLFLSDWNGDLLKPYEELVAERDVGTARLRSILKGFADEATKNPHFPQYYDLKPFWQTALKQSTFYGPEKETIRKIQETYASSGDLIKGKFYTSLDAKLSELGAQEILGLSDPTERHRALVEVLENFPSFDMLQPKTLESLIKETGNVITTDPGMTEVATSWLTHLFSSNDSEGVKKLDEVFKGFDARIKNRVVGSLWARGFDFAKTPAMASELQRAAEELVKSQNKSERLLGYGMKLSEEKAKGPEKMFSFLKEIGKEKPDEAAEFVLSSLKGRPNDERVAGLKAIFDRLTNKNRTPQIANLRTEFRSAIANLDQGREKEALVIRALMSPDKDLSETLLRSLANQKISTGPADRLHTFAFKEVLKDLEARSPQTKNYLKVLGALNDYGDVKDGQKILEMALNNNKPDAFFDLLKRFGGAGNTDSILAKAAEKWKDSPLEGIRAAILRVQAIRNPDEKLAREVEKLLLSAKEEGTYDIGFKALYSIYSNGSSKKDSATSIAYNLLENGNEKLKAAVLDRLFRPNDAYWTNPYNTNAIFKKVFEEKNVPLKNYVLENLLKDGSRDYREVKLSALTQIFSDLSAGDKSKALTAIKANFSYGHEREVATILKKALLSEDKKVGAEAFEVLSNQTSYSLGLSKYVTPKNTKALIDGDMVTFLKTFAQKDSVYARRQVDAVTKIIYNSEEERRLYKKIVTATLGEVLKNPSPGNKKEISMAVEIASQFRDPQLIDRLIKISNDRSLASIRMKDIKADALRILRDSRDLTQDQARELVKANSYPFENAKVTLQRLSAMRSHGGTDPVIQSSLADYLLDSNYELRKQAFENLQDTKIVDPEVIQKIKDKLISYAKRGYLYEGEPNMQNVKRLVTKIGLDEQYLQRYNSLGSVRKLASFTVKSAGGCFSRFYKSFDDWSLKHPLASGAGMAVGVVGLGVGGVYGLGAVSDKIDEYKREKAESEYEKKEEVARAEERKENEKYEKEQDLRREKEHEKEVKEFDRQCEKAKGQTDGDRCYCATAQDHYNPFEDDCNSSGIKPSLETAKNAEYRNVSDKAMHDKKTFVYLKNRCQAAGGSLENYGCGCKSGNWTAYVNPFFEDCKARISEDDSVGD